MIAYHVQLLNNWNQAPFPASDPGHFVYDLLFDQVADGIDVAFKVLTVHMVFKTGSAIPGLIKYKDSGIFVVLMQIVLDAADLFSGWRDELQQFALNDLHGVIFGDNLCYYC